MTQFLHHILKSNKFGNIEIFKARQGLSFSGVFEKLTFAICTGGPACGKINAQEFNISADIMLFRIPSKDPFFIQFSNSNRELTFMQLMDYEQEQESLLLFKEGSKLERDILSALVLAMESSIEKELIDSIITEFIDLQGIPDPEKARKNPNAAWLAKSYILSPEYKHKSINEICIKLGYHPSFMSRTFRRHFGMSPVAYRQLLKIAESKNYLRLGNHSTQLAQDLEFSDQSHFIRTFRKQYGLTPGEYQNLFKNYT